MARNSEMVGKSGSIIDLSKDQLALQKMKELEKKLKRKLVSVRIDKNTIVSTTKDKINDLVEEHLNPKIISR